MVLTYALYTLGPRRQLHRQEVSLRRKGVHPWSHLDRSYHQIEDEQDGRYP